MLASFPEVERPEPVWLQATIGHAEGWGKLRRAALGDNKF
jgi:hypothetical protein